MTRASRHLGVSQPAVSRLLTDLSADLGFALFERRDGRLTPTPEVRVLLPDIGRLMDLLDRISETSRNLNERKAGTLRIACLPGFAVSHLPRVLAAFLRDRPGITATIEPRCTATSSAMSSGVVPPISCSSARWAEDEIGRNSVIPCTTASMKSMNKGIGHLRTNRCGHTRRGPGQGKGIKGTGLIPKNRALRCAAASIARKS